MFYSRKPTRLPNYDYSENNYYFVTICTKNKACIFGTPKKLNALGELAKREIMELQTHYSGIFVDSFVIMPNHIHAIIVIQQMDESKKRLSLSQIIGLYKAGVTRKARKQDIDAMLWQRSFHDHIIRDQQ